MTSEGAFQLVGRVAATGLMTCVFVIGLAGAAHAASAIDPISIDDCHINNIRAFVSSYKPLAITFTNRRFTAADEVRFTVEYAGRTAHIADIGTFSHGIGIHHAFNAFYGLFYYGVVPKSCTVDYVHFTDGSVWISEPSPTPTSAHDQLTAGR